MRWRKVVPEASNTTAMWSASVSDNSFASILLKPSTAAVGVPSERESGGSAWEARKMKPDPSIRKTWCGAADGAADGGGTSAGRSLTTGAASSSMGGSFRRAVRPGNGAVDEQARAIGAFDAARRREIEVDLGMAERAAAAIASGHHLGDLDGLERSHRQSGKCCRPTVYRRAIDR